jgi:hypothetical protein
VINFYGFAKNQKNSQRRNATLKSQYQFRSLLQLIPKNKFDNLVKKWDADKGIKSFSCFEMTCVLIATSILGLDSFRDVEATMNIPKSTFGDALSKRPFGFFQELCVELLKAMKSHVSDRKIKRGIREILALDSSEIVVHGNAYSIPGWQQKAVRDQHKASSKIHTVWNINNEWIEDFRMTPGRKGDSPVSLEFRVLPGKMYVFDRAYNDLDFWYNITQVDSDFVSRLKSCPRIRILEIKLKIKKLDGVGVLYDGVYKPSKNTFQNHKSVPNNIKFRHIVYRDPATKKLFHFVTSDFNMKALEVAEVYKKRWAVELLYRWMKGHLKIRQLKTYKPNAIKIQLSIAVLVLLLLQFQKIVELISGSLWTHLRRMRAYLSRNGLVSQGLQDFIRDFPSEIQKSTA